MAEAAFQLGKQGRQQEETSGRLAAAGHAHLTVITCCHGGQAKRSLGAFYNGEASPSEQCSTIKVSTVRL